MGELFVFCKCITTIDTIVMCAHIGPQYGCMWLRVCAVAYFVTH